MNFLITPNWLSYKDLRRRLLTHWLRTYELPIEYFVSLPLPTQRFGQSAFIVFVAPANKVVPAEEGQPVQMDYQQPDRWFLLSAQTGQLLLYAHRTIFDYTDKWSMEGVDDAPNRTIGELQDALQKLEDSFERLLPIFFGNESLPADERARLRQTIYQFIAPQHRTTYEWAAPDFFSWLRP